MHVRVVASDYWIVLNEIQANPATKVWVRSCSIAVPCVSVNQRNPMPK